MDFRALWLIRLFKSLQSSSVTMATVDPSISLQESRFRFMNVYTSICYLFHLNIFNQQFSDLKSFPKCFLSVSRIQ